MPTVIPPGPSFSSRDGARALLYDVNVNGARREVHQETIFREPKLGSPLVTLNENTSNYAEWKHALDTALVEHSLSWVLDDASQPLVETSVVHFQTAASPMPVLYKLDYNSYLRIAIQVVLAFVKKSLPFVLIKRHKWDTILTPFLLVQDVLRLYGAQCNAVRAQKELEERECTFSPHETLSAFLDRHQSIMDDLTVLDAAVWARDFWKLKSLHRVLRKRSEWIQVVETLSLTPSAMNTSYKTVLETLRQLEVNRNESGIGNGKSTNTSVQAQAHPNVLHDQCTVHPSAGHTNALCRSQHPKLNAEFKAAQKEQRMTKRKLQDTRDEKRKKARAMAANLIKDITDAALDDE
jgi:hypothetical protein